MRPIDDLIDNFLQNTKFGRFYTGHRLLRYLLNLLALAVTFTAIHFDIYHLPENSFVLRSIVSLILFILIVSFSSVAVRFKKRTSEMNTLRFIIIAVIIFGLVAINLLIGCPNYVPPAPDPLPIL